ncbi:cytochrome P450 [Steroidobacter flavus]|uniref:Cytochrome P450 n=1 Tax=Steroidobacter flavus TaxID=1842136 RepID=A0ABV8T041_9GAMM
MSTDLSAELSAKFPPKRNSARPFDPPDQLLALLSQPLVRIRQWDGVNAWLIARYEDVRSVLNSANFSADPRKPGYPEKSAAYGATVGQDHNLRTMDEPEHGVQKRMLLQDFSVKRVNELRPAIQAKVDQLLDDMIAKGPPAEFVHDFALAIPTMVICELLGVPYADRDYFAEQTAICLSSDHPAEVGAAAGRNLSEYIDRLLDVKDATPENDLLSRLVVEQLRTGALSRKDVVGLARLILIAGHETTANTIALSTLALLINPDQAQILRAGTDAATLSNAIDELLRYLSVTHTGRRRVAIADVEINGQLIRAGEGVIILTNIADRDERIFDGAAKLDLKRKNARNLMTFGTGSHRCLGAFLSKVELEIAHSTLWRRLPGFRLACPFEQIEFIESGQVLGVRRLPVAW